MFLLKLWLCFLEIIKNSFFIRKFIIFLCLIKKVFYDLFKEENYKKTHMSKFVNEIVNSQNFIQFLIDNNNKYNFNYFIDVYKENLNHIVKRNKSIIPHSNSNRNVNNNNNNNNNNKSLSNIKTSIDKKAIFSSFFSNYNNNLTNESFENEDFL